MAPTRFKRSKVWLHFTKKDGNKATSSHCKVEITASGGNTTNMQKHLRTQHAITSVVFLTRFGLMDLNPAAVAKL